MIIFPTLLDQQNTEADSMQAVHFCFKTPKRQCCPSTLLPSQPASKGSLTIGGVIIPEQTWEAALEGRACSCCVPGLAFRVASLQRVSRQHSHQILDPPFTTSRSPNIITHTPTNRTLDNSKWLAAKVRSSPSRRRAACARGPTCRIALTQSSAGKTGGKTGGKAGGDSTGKTQKSHSAKAGLQVCDTQS